MNEIFVISLTWKDILIIENENKIYRKTNNDNGTYKLENNRLIINWSNWGEEIFDDSECTDFETELEMASFLRSFKLLDAKSKVSKII